MRTTTRPTPLAATFLVSPKPLLVACLFAFVPTSLFAQVDSTELRYTLQDPQTSPSDRQSPAPESTTTPLQLNMGDTPPPAQPPRPQPRAAVLGSQQPFGALGSSAIYVSPFTTFAGLSASASGSAVKGYFRSSAHRSMSRMPEMFGDLRRPGPAINFDSAGTGSPYDDQHHVRPEDFPTAASFSGLRISENNVALPQDRYWITYNHYHNAFAQPGGDLSLDRFVFGFEKTFFDGSSSVEIRLPIAADIEPNGTLTSNTSYAGGSYGNLSLLLKHVLYADDQRVIAAGLGIETPTGSQSHAFDTTFGPVSITHDPSAVYLTPFLGVQRTMGDDWFANGFLQLEVPTGGDRVITQVGAGAVQEFFVNQPAQIQIDLGIGAWLLSPSETDPTGLALISELHIATALQAPDRFDAVAGGATPNVFINSGDTIDTLVNLTNGIHASLSGGCSVRCGIAVPLLQQRIFDTEAIVQVNRSF